MSHFSELTRGFPAQFLDVLPLPMVVTKPLSDSSNSLIVFVNRSFSEQIGWSLKEIPDKQHWFELAFPDPDYKRVIERQWELALLNARETNDDFVFMETNIMTKFGHERRFKLFIQIHSIMLPGYHLTGFAKPEKPLL